MSTPANVIHVPRPSRGSFNPNRPLKGNQLLQEQVRHFRKRERELAPEQQTGIDIESIATEGEASEYIRKMTAILHPAGARKEKVRKAT
ncbi:MAG: hypothetical protein ABSF98_10530 [Bryobacteraceae bacterium]|jgi:hypothetical protein